MGTPVVPARLELSSTYPWNDVEGMEWFPQQEVNLISRLCLIILIVQLTFSNL